MPPRSRTNPPRKSKSVVGGPLVRETRATKRPDLPLPHDRDESTLGKDHDVDPVIDQARQDIEQGKTETDLRGKAGEAFERRWEGRRDRR